MTIYKCTEKDRESLLNFLSKDPSFNLFTIGDIENFGFDTEFQDVWVEKNVVGEIISCLLRYEGSFIPSAYGDYDIDSYCDIVENHPNTQMINGKKEIVIPLLEKMQQPWDKRRMMYFAELTKESFHADVEADPAIQKATINDVEGLYQLRSTIEEFSDSNTSVESLRRNLESGSSRTYFMKDISGKVVASASTTAENKYSAMVVGVCTAEQARQKGYASKLMIKLSEEVLNEGKTLCLFYDNPKAGQIYKRIGYKDIGEYIMAYKPV